MITIQDTIYMGTAAPASGGGGSITVDQTYDPISTNAQSGTAVAEALGTITSVQSVDNANTAVGAISPLKLWNGTEQEWNTGGGSQTWYCWDEFQGGVGVVGTWYTLDDPENITTETVLYSAPNVVDTSVTVTYGEYRSFSASNGHIGMYNARGNQTTTSSIGQAHPDWLCNIDEVGVKKGNTLIADLSSADNSTITKNNSNQLQTVGIINQNTSISAISQLKVWNGTEQEWNTGASQTWYNWKYTTPITWSSEYLAYNPSNDTIYVNGQYISVGTSNYYVDTSSDGTNWSNAVTIAGGGTSISGEARGIAYGNGKYIIVGGPIFSSTDLTNWTFIPSPSRPDNTELRSIIYVNNKFIAVGDSGIILSSADGSNWTAETSGVSTNLYSIAYGNGKYIAVGNNGTILSSIDGSTWTAETIDSSVGRIDKIIYANEQFILTFGDTNYMFTGVAYSSDGSTWTIDTSIPQFRYGERLSLAYGNGILYVGSTEGSLYFDGSNWSTVDLSKYINSIIFVNGKFLVRDGSFAYIITGGISSVFTDTTEPTTASTVYSEPSVTSALTITAVGTGTITLSDTNTYDYNASGNQTTISSVGQAHPDYLCFINGVGVKIGTTTIAQVNAS